MKKIIFLLSIIMSTVTFSFSQQLVFNITPTTTRAALDTMVTHAKKQNVYLKFTVEGFIHGRLTQVMGSVNVGSPKGSPSGTFTSDSLKYFKITVDGNPPKITIQGK